MMSHESLQASAAVRSGAAMGILQNENKTLLTFTDVVTA